MFKGIESIESLAIKNVKKLYNTADSMIYYYDVVVPHLATEHAKYNFIAFEQTADTKHKLILRDYTECIPFWISRFMHYKSILAQLRYAVVTGKAKQLNVAELSADEIQAKVNENIAALLRLNTYIGEQKIINAINKM